MKNISFCLHQKLTYVNVLPNLRKCIPLCTQKRQLFLTKWLKLQTLEGDSTNITLFKLKFAVCIFLPFSNFLYMNSRCGIYTVSQSHFFQIQYNKHTDIFRIVWHVFRNCHMPQPQPQTMWHICRDYHTLQPQSRTVRHLSRSTI